MRATTRHESLAPLLATWLAGVALACSDPAPSTDDSTDATTSSDTDSSESGTTESESEESETTGEPPPVCGDGIVGDGEACDDGNLEDGDGCTPSCEIGLCGFEWSTRELVLTGTDFLTSTPLVLDGEDLLVAHQIGDGAQQAALLRAGAADGVASASIVLELGPGRATPDTMTRGPNGELFMARVGDPDDTVVVHRLDDDGTVQWTVSRPTQYLIRELRVSPSGEVLLVNTIDNGPMDDQVELVALDPTDGSELWAHDFGGPVAPNGYSSDRSAALTIADDGRTYVGYDEYTDWDTTTPVVVAFNPDGDPTPLWSTEVLVMPGRQPRISGLAIGPSGDLAVILQREDGTQLFWVGMIDGESGDVEFLASRDDFDLPDQLTRVLAVAVTDDRVLTAGTWVVDFDGVEVRQGFVLGLDYAGQLSCVGTIDDYDPALGVTHETFLPADLLVTEFGIHLAGYAYDFDSDAADLLLAKIR